MLAEARRVVSVRDGDGTQEMSVYEVLVRKLMETSIKGSPYAQRVAFQTLKEAIANETQVKADTAALWRGYQRKARRVIAAGEKQGKPPPEILPHPDDIVIDGANTVTFDGPLTAEEASAFDHIAGQRDAFMRQHVLDARRARRKGEAITGIQPSCAYLMAVMANRVLPKRLQLDEQEMIALHYRFRTQTQRQLLRDNHRAWTKLRFPSQRDAVSPSVDALESILPALALIVQDLEATPGGDRDIEDALTRVVRVAASRAPCRLVDR
ncbi:hypothetical protein [Defluviimonas sp. SAOS-178_SWC]|uniref:hypothetical protein n=1 Tax=Defluviimonas sp. SAOS-178_SWC TaxID=3121287 RepID=UPI00322144E9